MIQSSLRPHAFFLIAALVVAIDLSAACSAGGRFDRVLEAGLLFDLVVLLPGLCWLCYRSQGRRAVVRAAALACLGIWALVHLIPPDEQDLLRYVAPLRYVGLAVLFLLEVMVLKAIYANVFSGKSAQEAASLAPKDLPPWIARLIALEAAFWHKAWVVIRRFVGRR